MSDGTDLRDRLAALAPEQRRLLWARLQSQRGGAGGTASPRISLFFFGDAGSGGAVLYDLLIRAARLADEGGLHAIWTPERHFQQFGGAYPDPSVLGAAIAVLTRRLQIRAGSVVLPINDVARVAERWSVVDILSNGRVGLSLASGWHPDDFVLARNPYGDRHRTLAEQLELLEQLWRGEQVEHCDPDGARVAVRIYPEPIQRRLPIWITCSKSPEAWRLAARVGANVLTGLLELSPEQLGSAISIYREALAENGWRPEEKQVTVMLHCYVGAPGESALDIVRTPLARYLRNHMRFYETMMGRRDLGIDVESLTEADREALVQCGVDRYLETSAMVGDLALCHDRATQLARAGVDEIACLVNFGLPNDAVLAGVARLGEIARGCNLRTAATDRAPNSPRCAAD